MEETALNYGNKKDAKSIAEASGAQALQEKSSVKAMLFRWKNYSLDFTEKTHVMGVLNVTPDSFSDGGRYLDKHRAVDRAQEMAAEGADIIDIGGQSTRPGSEPVPVNEELRRTIPVIGAVSKALKIPISIDTYRAEVARKALEAGSSIVNDISGLRFDPDMAEVVAGHDVPVVIMHIRGTPRDMQASPVYEALIPEIMDYLREGIRIAEGAGIDKIIIDPGIGFGKTFNHNLEIIKNLAEFSCLEKPLLVGPSRKAFIGKILGDAPPSERLAPVAERLAPVAERLEGTMAAVAISVLNGANMVRVHDVREAARVVRVADAIKRGRIN